MVPALDGSSDASSGSGDSSTTVVVVVPVVLIIVLIAALVGVVLWRRRAESSSRGPKRAPSGSHVSTHPAVLGTGAPRRQSSSSVLGARNKTAPEPSYEEVTQALLQNPIYAGAADPVSPYEGVIDAARPVPLRGATGQGSSASVQTNWGGDAAPSGRGDQSGYFDIAGEDESEDEDDGAYGFGDADRAGAPVMRNAGGGPSSARNSVVLSEFERDQSLL